MLHAVVRAVHRGGKDKAKFDCDAVCVVLESDREFVGVAVVPTVSAGILQTAVAETSS